MRASVRNSLLAAVTLGIACGDTPTELVPPTPVTPTQVTLKFCAGAPAWVAFQNDGGAWTQVTGAPSGTGVAYTFTLTTAKAGLAVVQTLTCSTINSVVYGTPAELATLYSGESCGAGRKTIYGTVAGGNAGQYSNISLGGGFDNVYGQSGAITLEGVAPGPQDLVASRWSVGGVDRMIVRRGVEVADGATLPLLDFNSSEAFAPDSARVSIQGLGSSGAGTFTYVSSSLYTAGGGRGSGSAAMTNGTAWYRGLPASATMPGDIHQIVVFGGDRYADMFVGPLANHAISLGPAAATPTVTTLSGAAPMRKRMTIPVQAGYSKVAMAGFESGTRPYYYVYVHMTEGYRGNAASWVLDVPDFGTTAGYNVAWGLQPSSRQLWRSEVYDWNYFEKFAPTVGLTRRRASAASPTVNGSVSPSIGFSDRQPGLQDPVSARYAQQSCS